MRRERDSLKIRTRDGTRLSYRGVLPDPQVHGEGPYDLVITYSGYQPSLKTEDGHQNRPFEQFSALGYAERANGEFYGFRRKAGAIDDIPTIGWATGDCYALACSNDGETVTGMSFAPGGLPHAFRWTYLGGTEDLGTIGGTVGASYGYDVSANGVVIVGHSAAPGGGDRAFRWTSSGGMTNLGTLGGFSRAYAVSDDGKTIVGSSDNSSGTFRAFRWTAASGMTALPAVSAGGSDSASHVSADGRIVVGKSGAGDSGGAACIWIDGEPRSLWDLLELEYAVNLANWTSLDEVSACSADGQSLVGYGVYQSAQTAFRVTLPPYNYRPTTGALESTSAECDGGFATVALATIVDDADGDALRVEWRVDGVVEKIQTNASPGSTVRFVHDYAHGGHEVSLAVYDGNAWSDVETAQVTVEDTTAPIVVFVRDVKVPVDEGKLFGTDVALPRPRVEDACDDRPRLSNDAPNRFPLGRTIVIWTIRDREGNVAKARQVVEVANGRPTANAGTNVVAWTRGEKASARVDGRASSDPDGHRLTYRWTAKGVKLKGATKPTATGVFPLGRTIVRLTVTDEANARSSDSAAVAVKRLKRTNAAAADEQTALAIAAANRTNASSTNEHAALACQAAAAAYACGVLAGDDFGLGVGAVSHSDRIVYATLRKRQADYSAAAAHSFLLSYASAGDEGLLIAYDHTAKGASYASADGFLP